MEHERSSAASADDRPPGFPIGIEDYGVTVSLFGVFNPAVFHPLWFRDQGLLGREDVEQATNVVQSDSSVGLRFRTESFSLEVAKDVLELTTRAAWWEEALGDLVVRLLRVLDATPIIEVSVARYGHLSRGEVADQAALLDSVLTAETDELPAGVARSGQMLWRLFSKQRVWDGLLSSPRVDEVTIRGDRPDDLRGGVLVTVEPSLLVAGIFVAYIDLFEVPDTSEVVEAGGGGLVQSPQARQAAEIVTDTWQSARTRASDVFRRLQAELVDGEHA